MDICIDQNVVGVALLVSNSYEGEKNLPFTHDDTNAMEETFKGFGYQVYKKQNLSYEDFKNCYRGLADYDYPPPCKRLLLYFSGHGADQWPSTDAR